MLILKTMELKSVENYDEEIVALTGQLMEIEDYVSDFNRNIHTYMQSMEFDENDFKVTIVSNGKKKRVSNFADPHDIDYIFNAQKPLSKNYKKAIRLMDVPKNETIMVGDQLMTDIFGANLIGLKSILVIPVKSKDGYATLLNRRIESMIMRYFRKKGLLVKED